MTILVVDADPDVSLLLSRMLEHGGFPNADCCPDAGSALELAARLSGDRAASLALVNIELPGVDGVELCRRLRSLPEYADLPILMLTTDPESPSLQEAYVAGAMDYLSLPLQSAEFALRVRSALHLGDEIRRRKAREAELAASLARLQRDLQAAGRLQRSLLPAVADPVAGVSVAWHFAPCDEVGGDLFDVLALPDGSVALYLLDVAGHGVPAALFSVGLRHLLSARASADPLLTPDRMPLPPDQVVASLNREFQMADDGLQYFTLIYAVLSPTDGALRFVQAGHPGMIIGIPGHPASVIGEGDMPVGLLPQAEYHTRSIQLPPGGRVLAYSDGVTEAARVDGEQFGQQRLLELFARNSDRPLAEMVAAIERAVAAWVAPARQQDDVSILAFERHRGDPA